MRFFIVGAAGFMADALILLALTEVAVAEPIAARAVSFSSALMLTWVMNRRWTFGSQARGWRALGSELVRYAAIQMTGGGVNLIIFSAIAAFFGGGPAELVIALAAGSAAGLLINYLGAERLVFGPRSGMRSVRAWLRRFLLLAAASVLMLAPMRALNGPFVNADSRDYFTIGASIVKGVQSILTGNDAASPGTVAREDVLTVVAAQAQDGDRSPGNWISAFGAARSGAYAIFLYLSADAATLWTTAFIQSFLAAWLISLIVAEMKGGFRARRFMIITAVCAAFSPLAFYATWPMPDIFAGLFVLAVTLFLFARTLNFMERMALWSLMAASIAMHTTILGLAVLAAGLGWIALLLQQRSRLAALAPVALLILSMAPAALFHTAYRMAAHRANGVELHSPPYLTARLLADGTGMKTLQDVCVSDIRPFELCRFRHQTYEDHNAFLWRDAEASYFHLDTATQGRLRDEQTRFVIETLGRYPLQQTIRSAGNAWRQLLTFGADDEVVTFDGLLAEWPDAEIARAAPENVRRCIESSTCPPAPDLRLWDAVILVTQMAVMAGTAAFIVLVFAARRRILPDDDDRRIIAAVCLAFALLVANAAMCGALSGVHDRYQGRLSWTLLALVLACSSQMISLSARALAALRSGPADTAETPPSVAG
jgi:putative flippase GtrA